MTICKTFLKQEKEGKTRQDHLVRRVGFFYTEALESRSTPHGDQTSK